MVVIGLNGSKMTAYNLAESDRPITTEELSQVNKIRTILPYIGDEMIRHCFEMLISTLNYAQA